MKYLLVLTALSIHATTATGQEAVNDSHLQQLADELIGYRDDDTNYEELYENLAQVLSSPYDLNRISREELQYLHILNDSQIKAFLDYRKDQGILVDIHELQVIPGFDSAAINRLLPFVRVIDPDSRVNTKLLRRIW